MRLVPLAAGIVYAGFVITSQSAFAQPIRITPTRPVAELRREALAARPPHESGKRSPDLVEVNKLDQAIRLDIRYAGTKNFMGAAFYEEERAFLQRTAAEALVRVNRRLQALGYGLTIFDAYRPWYVTKMFWDGTPGTPLEKRAYVADPKHGSNHNRGCAVDLTLHDRKTGQEVRMPSRYDGMSPRAYATYNGGTPGGGTCVTSCGGKWKWKASAPTLTNGGTSTAKMRRSTRL